MKDSSVASNACPRDSDGVLQLILILGGAVLILSVDNYDEGQVLVTLFSESLVTVYQTDPTPHYDWT